MTFSARFAPVAMVFILYTWQGCRAQLVPEADLQWWDHGRRGGRHPKFPNNYRTSTTSTEQSSRTRFHDNDDDDDNDGYVAWWGILIGVLVLVAVLAAVVVAGVCLCKRKKSRVSSSTKPVKQFINCDASPPAYTISDGRCDKATTKEAPPPYEIDIPPPAYTDQEAPPPVTPSRPFLPVMPMDETFKEVPLQ